MNSWKEDHVVSRRALKVFKKKVVKKSLGATPVCGSHLDVWADILFCIVMCHFICELFLIWMGLPMQCCLGY